MHVRQEGDELAGRVTCTSSLWKSPVSKDKMCFTQTVQRKPSAVKTAFYHDEERVTPSGRASHGSRMVRLLEVELGPHDLLGGQAPPSYQGLAGISIGYTRPGFSILDGI